MLPGGGTISETNWKRIFWVRFQADAVKRWGKCVDGEQYSTVVLADGGRPVCATVEDLAALYGPSH